MKIRNRMYYGKIPLWTIFWFGVLAGIIGMNLGKGILLEHTGLLDEYALYHMKYMTVDSSALFYYVLRLRLKTVIFLIVLATTYLGLAVCVGSVFWYGLSTGAFLAALMVRYSLKGVIFAALGVFPQGLFYVPAMAALMAWCMRLHKGIYASKGTIQQEAGVAFPASKRIFQLIVILAAILLGCLAESFVNPGIMVWLLKNY